MSEFNRELFEKNVINMYQGSMTPYLFDRDDGSYDNHDIGQFWSGWCLAISILNPPTLPADVVAYIKQLEDALQKLNNHWGVKESHKFTPHEHDLNINAHRARSSRPTILDKI